MRITLPSRYHEWRNVDEVRTLRNHSTIKHYLLFTVIAFLLVACTPTRTPSAIDSIEGQTIRWNYATLIYLDLDATLGLFEDTVAPMEDGESGGINIAASTLAIASVLGDVRDLLRNDPPIESLAPTWQEAQGVYDATVDLYACWQNGIATASVIAGELSGVRARMATTIANANAMLSSEYGFTNADLEAIRDEVPSDVAERVSAEDQ